ncbi:MULTISPECIES: branched-chain amino acid ABC transporter permease [Sinorhizobium]|uniref:branched-chain amino acid ABC transporter permease n=1 Tax=Sinorhizobium TaxID=28105 RepID=UPI00192DC887|nr:MULTISPECIES: branched-chain amino acid ABC transporter permease [Sinorhizobium]
MFELLEFGIRGLFLGVTIGLIALPISILFLTTDSVDLAVGGYAVLAGAVTLMVSPTAGVLVGAIAGILIAMSASAVVGLISLRLNRPGRHDHITVVLATFGAAAFLESFVLTVFGKDPIVRRPFEDLWEVFGLLLNPQVFINFAVALTILLVLSLFLYATPFGRAMRASSVNPLGASLAGIPVQGIWFSTYIIGGLLAGIAGALIVNTTGMDYMSGLSFTLGAFGAAILFGLRSPLRAFVGGIVMGMVQAYSAGYLPGAWATALPLGFIFVVLSAGRMTRSATGGRA